MNIGEFSGRSNNLNLMKFAAAILVIYAHSYVVTGSDLRTLPWPEGVVMDWGGLAVAFFLFSSGFYVTKSLLEKRKERIFWIGRVARIYPAFLVVMLFTVLVLGPIITECSLTEYFFDKRTYQHLLYLCMIPQYELPAVFANNPYPYVVNASLWTLVLEFICYIGVFCAYKMKLLEKRKLKIINIFLIMIIIVVFIIKIPMIYAYNAYLRPLTAFIIGMEYYIFRDDIKLNRKNILIVLAGGYFLFRYNYIDLWMLLLFPYLICFCIFSKVQIGEKTADLGKYSYSIYLTAFPIQQVLVYYMGTMSVFWNTTLTVIISLCVAKILYCFIERPYYEKILRLVKR